MPDGELRSWLRLHQEFVRKLQPTFVRAERVTDLPPSHIVLFVTRTNDGGDYRGYPFSLRIKLPNQLTYEV